MQKDVGDLEITVDDVHIREIDEAIEDIFEEGSGCLFGEVASFLVVHVEVAAVALFSDDEALLIGGDDFLAGDAVGVVHLLEDIEF